ncbi:MAG: hypothetical protein EXX96DRAFT_265710 [Benjaminiella poitrasii]|nr:MAG: hypothetical protein EXX96DRAFT_265710 [Benjaminiella poitrasii]
MTHKEQESTATREQELNFIKKRSNNKRYNNNNRYYQQQRNHHHHLYTNNNNSDFMIPSAAANTTATSTTMPFVYYYPPQHPYYYPFRHPHQQQPLLNNSTINNSPTLTRDDEDLEIIMHDESTSSSYSSNINKMNSDQNFAFDLKKQLEFYFSRQNLINDTYLVSQMDSELYVPISLVANFTRVREHTTDMDLILKTLKESSAVIVDETETKVKPNISLKRNTVIMRDVPECTIEEMNELLKELDSPPVQSMKQDIGNMWYFTFESEEDALKLLLNVRGKTFKGQDIAARMKSEPALRIKTTSSNNATTSGDSVQIYVTSPFNIRKTNTTITEESPSGSSTSSKNNQQNSITPYEQPPVTFPLFGSIPPPPLYMGYYYRPPTALSTTTPYFPSQSTTKRAFNHRTSNNNKRQQATNDRRYHKQYQPKPKYQHHPRRPYRHKQNKGSEQDRNSPTKVEVNQRFHHKKRKETTKRSFSTSAVDPKEGKSHIRNICIKRGMPLLT